MKSKLIIIMFTVIVSLPLACAQQKVKEIRSTDVLNILKSDTSYVVLDVRTPEEYNAGHIKNAVNIDINQQNALKKIDSLDITKKYIVHCRTNHRSKKAVDYMAEQGFSNIYQMMDGYEGWNQNNLPLEK